MSRHPYTEDQLVEQPAIGLFATLGWQTASALNETFGAGGTLGRETKSEVVLVQRLRAALCKFNPALPPEAISNAVDELTHAFATVVNSLPEAYIRYSRIANEGVARWPVPSPTRKLY
ncbi:MAG: type I restriction endonuclease, partial [Candidatus Competibacter sp.]